VEDRLLPLKQTVRSRSRPRLLAPLAVPKVKAAVAENLGVLKRLLEG